MQSCILIIVKCYEYFPKLCIFTLGQLSVFALCVCECVYDLWWGRMDKVHFIMII